MKRDDSVLGLLQQSAIVISDKNAEIERLQNEIKQLEKSQKETTININFYFDGVEKIVKGQ